MFVKATVDGRDLSIYCHCLQRAAAVGHHDHGHGSCMAVRRRCVYARPAHRWWPPPRRVVPLLTRDWDLGNGAAAADAAAVAAPADE